MNCKWTAADPDTSSPAPSPAVREQPSHHGRLLRLRGWRPRGRYLACLLAGLAALSPLVAFADEAAPKPAFPGVFGLWQVDPLFIAIIAVTAGLYAAGVVRVNRMHPGSPVPTRRIVFFALGLLALVIAIISPLAEYDDTLLQIHMWQHLVIMEVAAPLLLFGAPITLILRASTPHFRKRYALPVLHSRVVRFLSFPVVAWFAFLLTLAIVHYAPIYNESLVNNNVHETIHVAFLLAGLLFYWPALGVDPSPSRWGMSYPVRLVYMLTMMAPMAILGVVFWSSNHVIYTGYLDIVRNWGPSVLSDQHTAGLVMWIGGGGIDMLWMPYVAYRWVKHEELVERRTDRELARQRAAAVSGPAGPGASA